MFCVCFCVCTCTNQLVLSTEVTRLNFLNSIVNGQINQCGFQSHVAIDRYCIFLEINTFELSWVELSWVELSWIVVALWHIYWYRYEQLSTILCRFALLLPNGWCHRCSTGEMLSEIYQRLKRSAVATKYQWCCYFVQWYDIFKIRFSVGSKKTILRLVWTSRYNSCPNITCDCPRCNDVILIVCQCGTVYRIRCDDDLDHTFIGKTTWQLKQRLKNIETWTIQMEYVITAPAQDISPPSKLWMHWPKNTNRSIEN